MITLDLKSPELEKVFKDGLTDIVNELRKENDYKEKVLERLDSIGIILGKIYDLALEEAKPLRPKGFLVTLIGENEMALVYSVAVDAQGSPDVVKRVMTVKVGDAEPTNSEFPAGTSDLGTITVPQDSVVKISVVDVDDAGLSSSPLEMEFTAVDMIPPVAPTGLNVTLKEETA